MTLLTFWRLKLVVAYTVNGGTDISQISFKKIFICVPKSKESLRGMEWHGGEQLTTEFSILDELAL